MINRISFLLSTCLVLLSCQKPNTTTPVTEKPEPVFNGTYLVNDSVVTESHFNGTGQTNSTVKYSYYKKISISIDSSSRELTYNGMVFTGKDTGTLYTLLLSNYRTVTATGDSVIYTHFESLPNHSSRSIVLRGYRN